MRGDDSWTWLPGERRIRRLNESILSTSWDRDFDPDHYSGYNPKTEQYDYVSWVKKRCSPASMRRIPQETCLRCRRFCVSRGVEMRHMYIVDLPRGGAVEPAACWRARRWSTSTPKSGSNPTSTPTVATDSSSGQIYTGSRIGIVRFRMPRSRSIPSNGSSSSARVAGRSGRKVGGVLSAGPRNPGTGMLVHQHGRG